MDDETGSLMSPEDRGWSGPARRADVPRPCHSLSVKSPLPDEMCAGRKLE